MNIVKQVQALALVNFLLLALFPIEGNPTIPNTLSDQNSTKVSPWLKKVVKNQRPFGCRERPWVCNEGGFFPPRSMCCRNRCVNVTSDKNNCGLCGIRCPFNWECCRGLCRDINFSVFNCGRCGHRCPFGQPCLLGMCGYGGGASSNVEPPKVPKTQFGHSPYSHQSHETRKEEF